MGVVPLELVGVLLFLGVVLEADLVILRIWMNIICLCRVNVSRVVRSDDRRTCVVNVDTS
jgi:hypothetical protein